MERTNETPSMAEELKKYQHVPIRKRNRFEEKSRMACRLFEMIFDEITPALRKCNETKDAVIMISAYRKRLKRLHRKAMFYDFLSKIFK